jgi:predicted RNA-binding protein YlqC (UPF0109 family)
MFILLTTVKLSNEKMAGATPRSPMLNVKTRMLPRIIGANGTIAKSLRNYVTTIPGRHDVRGLQKPAILGIEQYLSKC